METLVVGIVLVILMYIVSTLWFLNRNYRAARAVGVPIVICPYDPENYIHSLLCVPLRPLYRRLLPSRFFATVELSIWGWEFRDKAAIHEKLGPTFMLVTTGVNRLVSADPGLAQNVLTRRMAFLHPEISTQAMGLAGGNIITAKGDSWSRQRRIIAPALNDRISPAVWKESAEQASVFADLLVDASASWMGGEEPGQTVPGLRAIAINVLAHIAYGHHKHFVLPCSNRNQYKDMTYVDAISICTELLILAAFLPARLLRLPIMPHMLQTLGTALTRLPDLTRDMLQKERQRSLSIPSAETESKVLGSSSHPETIMSTLVRLSDQEKNRESTEVSAVGEKHAATAVNRSNKSFLTEDEIAGNLFIFTAAGFDTTANTMGYAVTLLAAYPEWQPWIQTEIDAVMGGAWQRQRGELQMPEYATSFPRLVRCMAIMLETLRLFPPVTLLMRASETDQTIPLGNSSTAPLSNLPPCSVYINVMALHTSKSVWGPDALEFNPKRWIQQIDGAEGTKSLVQPPRGTYIPWSTGPRSCPGQKMSQVEFVTVIATLFGKCTAQPVLGMGESTEEGRRKLVDLMEDSQPVLTLQMNSPKDVRIEWRRR